MLPGLENPVLDHGQVRSPVRDLLEFLFQRFWFLACQTLQGVYTHFPQMGQCRGANAPDLAELGCLYEALNLLMRQSCGFGQVYKPLPPLAGAQQLPATANASCLHPG
jgi:hypothetical protein